MRAVSGMGVRPSAWAGSMSWALGNQLTPSQQLAEFQRDHREREEKAKAGIAPRLNTVSETMRMKLALAERRAAEAAEKRHMLEIRQAAKAEDARLKHQRSEAQRVAREAKKRAAAELKEEKQRAREEKKRAREEVRAEKQRHKEERARAKRARHEVAEEEPSAGVGESGGGTSLAPGGGDADELGGRPLVGDPASATGPDEEGVGSKKPKRGKKGKGKGKGKGESEEKKKKKKKKKKKDRETGAATEDVASEAVDVGDGTAVASSSTASRALDPGVDVSVADSKTVSTPDPAPASATDPSSTPSSGVPPPAIDPKESEQDAKRLRKERKLARKVRKTIALALTMDFVEVPPGSAPVDGTGTGTVTGTGAVRSPHDPVPN
jgi:hypothetical protein